MCVNLGFGCNGTRSNTYPKNEAKNNMEVATIETPLVLDPILEHETSNLDAPPKCELMYILVILQ